MNSKESNKYIETAKVAANKVKSAATTVASIDFPGKKPMVSIVKNYWYIALLSVFVYEGAYSISQNAYDNRPFKDGIFVSSPNSKNTAKSKVDKKDVVKEFTYMDYVVTLSKNPSLEVPNFVPQVGVLTITIPNLKLAALMEMICLDSSEASVAKLKEFNGKAGQNLYPGQRLNIPYSLLQKDYRDPSLNFMKFTIERQ